MIKMPDFCEKNGFFEEFARFEKVIKNLARKLNDTQAEGELFGFLWLLQNRPKPPPNDYYILACLKREYIRLSKEESKTIAPFLAEIGENFPDIDFRFDFNKAFSELTPKQKRVFALKFYGFSMVEIAEMNGISRQAVNQIYNRARAVLKRSLNYALDKK